MIKYDNFTNKFLMQDLFALLESRSCKQELIARIYKHDFKGRRFKTGIYMQEYLSWDL